MSKIKRLRFFSAIHLLACIFFLLSGCTQDKDYTQWELPEDAKLRIGRGRIEALKFSPDGRSLAVATSAGIWLYETETYNPRKLITADKGRITAIAFSADSRRVAGASGNYTLSVWDARSGHPLKTFGLESSDPEVVGGPVQVVFVAFSPDGRRLVSFARYEDTLRVWDVRTGRLLKTFRETSSDTAAFSPDGHILALGGEDWMQHSTINLWDAETGRHLKIFSPPGRISAMVFSPDSQILAAVACSYWRETIYVDRSCQKST